MNDCWEYPVENIKATTIGSRDASFYTCRKGKGCGFNDSDGQHSCPLNGGQEERECQHLQPFQLVSLRLQVHDF